MKCLTKLSVCLVFVTVTLHGVKAVIPDNECTSDPAGDTKCKGEDPNAVCSADTLTCACTTDYFLSSDKTLCVQKITTVECTTAAGGTATCQNVDENSECPSDGTCICKEGYAGIDFCTNVITDITCTSGDTCQDVDLNADCPTNSATCSCTADYFFSHDKTKCVQKIVTVGCTPGDPGTTECQKVDINSECKTGSTCTCKAGYKGTDSCTKEVLTGHCTTPGDCTDMVPNSECSASTCSCVTGYKEANNLCIIVLGETCSVADDCTGWVDNSVCSSEKKCACEANYIKDGVACRKAAVTEITCDAGDEDCTVDHTECDDAETSPKCKCSDGYKKDSTDGSTCVKIIGGTCGGNDDCTRTVINSVCTAGKCECNENYIEESAVCKKALGQTCTDQDTCVSNAECDEECTCSSGFTNSNGFCATESSATSVWMASSLLVTALLIHLPRFILW